MLRINQHLHNRKGGSNARRVEGHCAAAPRREFVEADGSTVKGFRPGYTAGSWEYHDAPYWALAHLPSGMECYFVPKFTWNGHEHCLVDVVSDRYGLFSIGSKT